MIPVYRAKKIGDNEWIEGKALITDNKKLYIVEYVDVRRRDHAFVISKNARVEIDPKTLAIHFENMISVTGEKIFASLNKDGTGGDRVSGMCRDCNGDELQGLHAPVPFEGIVRFYSETVMGVVIETTDRIAVGTKDWVNPIVLERGSALRWSDCRHNIEIVGICKEEESK